MVRVLLVEDDQHIVSPLVRVLNAEGYAVAHAPTGLSALEKIKSDPPDLVLLDVNLPDLDGFNVCKNIRQLGLDFPVIMMSALDQKSDVVHGLNVGADDYLTKPFVRSELIARLKAVSRRTILDEFTYLKIGNVALDRKSRLCTAFGNQVTLTPTEFALLDFLMQNQGRAVKRTLIIREIWSTGWLGPTKNLDMHISSLRRKLGPAAIQLKTIRGLGYRFDEK